MRPAVLRQGDFSCDFPFRFTGTIDKLNYRLGPEQLTAETSISGGKTRQSPRPGWRRSGCRTKARMGSSQP
jgi:hypothetical protein